MKSTYLKLHIAVFLLAFTAILGAWISLDAIPLVWYRTGIATLVLGVAIWLTGKSKFQQTDLLTIFRLGVLLAIHWVLFFQSVKTSNVSVALISYSMTAFFTSFIEPFFLRTKFQKRQLISAIVMVPAIAMIAGQLEGNLLTGFLYGILSSLFMALLAAEQKKILIKKDSLVVTFMQLAGAFVILSAVQIPFGYTLPSQSDWIGLLILGVVCTALGWKLIADAMKKLSAFDITLAYNLEPLYGIILGSLIFHEHEELGTLFYAGAFLLILIIFIQPILSRYDKQGDR